MYIAYSALAPKEYIEPTLNRQPETQRPETTRNNLLIRHKAYIATCEKYRHEITAIQKYIPGWQPKFY